MSPEKSWRHVCTGRIWFNQIIQFWEGQSMGVKDNTTTKYRARIDPSRGLAIRWVSSLLIIHQFIPCLYNNQFSVDKCSTVSRFESDWKYIRNNTLHYIGILLVKLVLILKLSKHLISTYNESAHNFLCSCIFWNYSNTIITIQCSVPNNTLNLVSPNLETVIFRERVHHSAKLRISNHMLSHYSLLLSSLVRQWNPWWNMSILRIAVNFHSSTLIIIIFIHNSYTFSGRIVIRQKSLSEQKKITRVSRWAKNKHVYARNHYHSYSFI